MASENDILTGIWENWRTKNGAGHCEGCDAHWSIRDDYPGDPETRTSSCGHRPFYGDGQIVDPDIVIYGHEPGNDFDHEPNSDPDQFGPNYTQYSFDDARYTNVTQVPVGANSIEDTQALFDTLDKEFDIYWSQVKKCNELDDDKLNANAADQCAMYLPDEIQATDPDYVISFGKKAYQRLCEVFDIDSLNNNFARGIADGERSSGFQPLTVDDESFVYIPLGHPSFGIDSQTKEKLSIDSGDMSDTQKYYELVAQDLIQYDQED